MKAKNYLLSSLIVIVLLAMCFAVLLVNPTMVADADIVTSDDKLTFSLYNNDGVQEYQVAIKTTAKAAATFIIIPESYNGLPVSKIANNGFMSCMNLEKIILPTSIKEIGTNAFMNCINLERVTLPAVESIGSSAFGLCPSLERLYIPSTVTEVGATILRNNAQTVYLQSSLSDTVGWSPTWNDYHTGEIIDQTTVVGTLHYREILDNNDEVCGYELPEELFLVAPGQDLVIESSYTPQPGVIEPKPLLNICPQAFTLSMFNSLTIQYAEGDSHSINIRSEAFASAFINEINIEVDVTLVHPNGLPNQTSLYDGHTVTGDGSGNSTGLFFESSVSSITLPSSLNVLTDNMFQNCVYLTVINMAGGEETLNNHLTNICSIGDSAFYTCTRMEEISFSDSLTEVGENAFYNWGATLEQTINIDNYIDEIDDSLLPDALMAGDEECNLVINYLQTVAVTLIYADDTTETIAAKSGRLLPEIEMPVRNGYEFGGFNTQSDGNGDWYYDSLAHPVKTWRTDDATTLYAQWEALYFNVTDSVTNASFSGELTGLFGDDYSTTISADTGYNLPADLTVTIDDESYTDFSYNSTTGAFSIDAEDIVGEIVVSGAAVLKTYAVIDDIDNATLSEAGEDVVTHGVAYSATITANFGYNLPASVTVTVDEESYTDFSYNSVTGALSIDAEDVIGDIVVSGAALLKTYDVVGDIDYATLSEAGDDVVTHGDDYVGTLTADTYYNLPETLTVTIDDESYTDFSYNSTTGAFSIDADDIVGDIVISGEATPMTFSVTNSIDNTTLDTEGSTAATFGANYTSTITANTGYDLPETITVTVDGEEIDDYTYLDGEISISGDLITGNVVISGAASVKTYTVTYESGDEITDDSYADTKNHFDDLELMGAVYSRTGFTQTGWSTSATGSPKAYNLSGSYTTNSDITLYPSWERNEYSISYVLDGGTNDEDNPDSYLYEDSFTLDNPSKIGHTFDGWYSDEDLTSAKSGISSIDIGDITFYAKWEANNYDISYVLNGGSNSSANPQGYTFGQSFTLSNPSRTGYTFGGWYSDADLTSAKSGITSTDTGDKTFYAKWTLTQYSISYSLYGGSNHSNNPQSYTYGQSITLYSPSQTGYTFEGWYSNSARTTPKSGISSTETGAKTFYAKWRIIDYSISYVLNGGSNHPYNPPYYNYGDSFTLIDPSREGFTFNGWYRNSTFTSSKNGISSSDIGDKTFYAKWTAIPYSITYVLNGDNVSSSNPSSYTAGQSFTLSDPTRTGYTFGGWYSNSALTSPKSGISSTDTGAKTFYAKWTGNVLTPYTITYVLNGGTNSSSNPSNYYYGDSFTLSSPSRSGYTFGGWYSNSALTSPQSGISSTDTGAKTFYAKWTSIPSNHSVYFEENNYVTFIPDPDYNSQVAWGYEGFTTIVPHGGYVNIEYSAKVASSGIRITVNGSINSSASIRVMGDTTVSAIYVGTNSISNMSLIITEEIVDGEITWNVDVEEE